MAEATVESAEEFEQLLPPDAEFRVLCSERAGRFMVSDVPLRAGYDFLIESPLVAWPLAAEPLQAPLSGASHGEDLPVRWCERCFRQLDDGAVASVQCATPVLTNERRVRRRIVGKTTPLRFDPSDSAPESSQCRLYCTDCERRLRGQPCFFTSDLLWRWRNWQAAKSPESRVGLEAFARCFAQIAATAATLRSDGVPPDEALHAAMRPFDRLAAPPDGATVQLHGTTADEIATELLASEPFASTIAAAVGDGAASSSDLIEAPVPLISAASVEALAGRLVLNACGVQVPWTSAASGNIAETHESAFIMRGAGIFVLLSTMNHGCEPSAAATWEYGTNEVTLRTTRDVAAGEPLTLAYVPVEWPLNARRDKLRHWFFDCDCWRCESESRIAAFLGEGGCEGKSETVLNTGTPVKT